MTFSSSQKIAVFICFFAIGIGWKGWWELSFLLFLVSLAFLAPRKFWVALGVMIADAWNYGAPRAVAAGGQAANHAGQVAHQASNGFRADPWFWLGTITSVLAIAFLLGAAWNESMGVLQVSLVLFAFSAACFITYYNGWKPLGNGLAKAGTFVKTKAVATTAKYPLQVWCGVSILFFALALYNDWSSGAKWFWGFSTVCAIVTIFKWWPKVGNWALKILKTSVGGNGFTNMILLDGALLCVYGYYVSQNIHYNLGTMITTGAIGAIVVVLGLKKFFEYGNK